MRLTREILKAIVRAVLCLGEEECVCYCRDLSVCVFTFIHVLGKLKGETVINMRKFSLWYVILYYVIIWELCTYSDFGAQFESC